MTQGGAGPRQPSIEDIAHNTQEHVEALEQILFHDAAVGGARDRLLAHIERETRYHLGQLQGLVAEAEDDVKLRLLFDHNELLLDIIAGDEIKPEMSKELLHHFREEHEEWLVFGEQESRSDAVSEPRREGPQLTLGSLIEKRDW